MAKSKVVVTGIKAIDRKLRALPLRIQKKVVNQAMREGMKVVRKAALSDVPVDTGVTKAHIKVRAGLKRKRDQVSIDVRVDADDATKKTSAKTGETVFYPAIVEYKRDRWMYRAYIAVANAARRVTIARLKAGIEREAKSI